MECDGRASKIYPYFVRFCLHTHAIVRQLQLLIKDKKYDQISTLLKLFEPFVSVFKNPVLRRTYFFADSIPDSYKWTMLAYPENAKFLALMTNADIVDRYQKSPKPEMKRYLDQLLLVRSRIMGYDVKKPCLPSCPQPTANDFILPYNLLIEAFCLFQHFALLIHNAEATRSYIANKKPRVFEGYPTSPPMPLIAQFSLVAGIPAGSATLLVFLYQCEEPSKGPIVVNPAFRLDVYDLRKVSTFSSIFMMRT